ncbi:hypothetical protein [Delftia sp. PS-11]|uniref:hypothetical protein n=1 Tax=Delftia sp. PS-11 TaxID=2767222 RepID=UPI0024584017|nr:hypothetical protein [Delftia sp. PS-11]KAJ8744585.1 hypothetical protein H9T68_11575 [Delftia sp. PS-11]
MSLKAMSGAIALTFLLSGCAVNSSFEDRAIKAKDYSGALYSVSIYKTGASSKDIDRVVARIKEDAGPQYKEKLFDDTKIFISYKEKNKPFFQDMRLYLNNAKRMGLLNDEQAQLVDALLYKELASQALARSNFVDGDLRGLYPDLNNYMGAAREVEYQRALKGELPTLASYALVYESTNAVDSVKAQALLPVIRTRLADLVKNMTKGSGGEVSAVISIYSVAKDSQVEQLMLQFLSKVDLTKDQVKNEVAAVKPDFAAKILAQREVKLKIVSDSNDPFIDELPKAIEELDEWVTIDDDSDRRINIARLRFSERPSSPVVRSQTLRFPDFATLLFIPKNASVIYDTVTTGYDVNWSMNVSDSAKKGSKVISGKKSEQKVECSNIRYKNVFGGEGALGFVPDGIQAECSAKSNIDFDNVRKSAVKEIATEILQVVRNEKK